MNRACRTQFLRTTSRPLVHGLLPMGLRRLVQYAEAVAPQTDWSYITPVQNDADMWPFVGRISYHNYGTADPYRSFLRDYGKRERPYDCADRDGQPDLRRSVQRSDSGRRFLLGSRLQRECHSRSQCGTYLIYSFRHIFSTSASLHYVRPGRCESAAFPVIPLCMCWHLLQRMEQ